MKTVILSVVFSIFLVRCASLTPGGKRVRMFSGNPSQECNFLGTVSGSSASAFGGSPYNNAKVDMMNETAQLGGNYVRTISKSGGLVLNLSGEAYACPSSTRFLATTPVARPSAEQQIANEMRRRNDNEDDEREMRAFQQLQQTLSPQPAPKVMRCNSSAYGNSITTDCTEY